MTKRITIRMTPEEYRRNKAALETTKEAIQAPDVEFKLEIDSSFAQEQAKLEDPTPADERTTQTATAAAQESVERANAKPLETAPKTDKAKGLAKAFVGRLSWKVVVTTVYDIGKKLVGTFWSAS